MGYAALMTLPDRRQRVQTRRRRMPPFTTARTRWRFGSNRRGGTLCAWLMLRPTTGPLLQISHRFAMIPTPELQRNDDYSTFGLYPRTSPGGITIAISPVQGEQPEWTIRSFTSRRRPSTSRG